MMSKEKQKQMDTICFENTTKLEIDYLPENIGSYVNLESLYIKGVVYRFPESFWQLSLLQHLKIDSIATAIPPQIRLLANLTDIEFGEGLDTFPNSITALTNLKELHLGNTRMSSIEQITALEDLEVFTIGKHVLSNFSCLNLICTLRVIRIESKSATKIDMYSTLHHYLEELSIDNTYYTEIDYSCIHPRLKKLKMKLQPFVSNMYWIDYFISNPYILEEFNLDFKLSKHRYQSKILPVLQQTVNLKRLSLCFEENVPLERIHFDKLAKLEELKIQNRIILVDGNIFAKLHHLERLEIFKSKSIHKLELPSSLQSL